MRATKNKTKWCMDQFNKSGKKSDCSLAGGNHFIYVKISPSAKPQGIGEGVERGWRERKTGKRREDNFKRK